METTIYHCDACGKKISTEEMHAHGLEVRIFRIRQDTWFTTEDMDICIMCQKKAEAWVKGFFKKNPCKWKKVEDCDC